MLSEPNVPRPWQVAVGGVMLLTISLYLLYDALVERRDRSEVLAHGRDARARVVRATGLEAVRLEWTDEGGRHLSAQSRTGKPFTRTGLGTMVLIKYDPESIRMPVVLSEASERERVDTFWLQSSLLTAAMSAMICVAACFATLRERRMRMGATRK